MTTACDIYALGVLLYKILAGVRSYETSGKPLDEILRIVVEREPRRPSAAAARGPQPSSAAAPAAKREDRSLGARRA